MDERIGVAGLAVAKPLFELIEQQVLPETRVTPERFWRGLADMARHFGPRNRALLVRRVELQEQIDDWHRERRGQPNHASDYQAFLREIGYLQPEGEAFQISADHLDPEVAQIAGPQLVVPLSSACDAVDAANARWRSLFDALYGSDLLPEDGDGEEQGHANPRRSARVSAVAKDFLDQAAPLADGSYSQAIAYGLRAGQLLVSLASGRQTGLANPAQLRGYRLDGERLAAVLLVNHGLHIEIVLSIDHPVQQCRPTGIRDVVLEAAITTILDGEDMVAAVDGEDKVALYRHWLGLMRGDLTSHCNKHGQPVERALAADRVYTGLDGKPLVRPGRSLLLVRNVGHLMTTDAVLDSAGLPIFEGLLDGLVTAACALHDLAGLGRHRNSRSGSVYIVKPKLHGPDEVAFTADMFAAIEALLDMAPNTLKLGLTDEERRTTVNLRECLRAARQRLFLTHTSFFDRAGDEIHTCKEAGPVLRKQGMKQADWLLAYEDWNIDVALDCGLAGRGQVGKGMWTEPDNMAAMMTSKVAHPQAGASCAWVPTPTAAALLSMHYHQVDVAARQEELAGRHRATLDDLLHIPRCEPHWTADQVQQELDSNIQTILGYVVRWVEQGVGVSKIPDIHGIERMEDRGTLRISSQHVANWLYHGVVSEQQVRESLERMAQLVDRQNLAEPGYIPMAPAFDGLAYRAACELVFETQRSPNGYTEPLLYRYRRAWKQAMRGGAEPA
jgi:malate synthase